MRSKLLDETNGLKLFAVVLQTGDEDPASGLQLIDL
jgi:hypothetical protein